MQPYYIAGSSAGLQTDKKPFLLPDQAFQRLENAYVWRDRVKKREGLEFLNRLRRFFSGNSIGNTGASPWTFNIYSTVVPAITPEANAEIDPESVVITIAGPIIFEDQGDGTLTSTTPGNSGTINYITGDVTLTHTAGAGIATTITFGYFPSLPVTGIWQREESATNEEQTIFFDTKYAYTNISGTLNFEEFIPGTTWDATDSDLMWCTNYRGVDANLRLFFATNFINDVNNFMYYTDGSTWTAFAPGVSGATSTGPDTVFMTQARILIPYYGRLLAFNTWEGGTIGTAVNYFNRCRFSQVGNPVQVTSAGPFVGGAWRSDVIGKGGFIDAPTSEAIISVAFIKNDLIVFFERSTWGLRYVGDYGLPFIWERISSDYGAESTFATVVFDDSILAVGDKAIVQANALTVQRIDEKIPDLVFGIKNKEKGTKRVVGIRDFKRELVFWCYPDMNQSGTFPSKTFVYNYRNNTWATFRNNVTFFGTFQRSEDTGITWSDETVFWSDETVFWTDDADLQDFFPSIVCGNQQGFISFFGYTSADEPTLAITDLNSAASIFEITVPSHNLEPYALGQGIDGVDVIYITGVLVSGGSTDINDRFYAIQIVDEDTVKLFEWNSSSKTYGKATISFSGTYIGGGRITLFPRMYIQTKDFNPFQAQGGQFKLSYIDFLTDATPSASVDIDLYINSSLSVKANLLVGNTQVETSLTAPFYVPGSNYAWHRFYATTTGQFLNYIITYNGDLMNELTTHQQEFTLNAMAIWMRPGGKIVF